MTGFKVCFVLVLVSSTWASPIASKEKASDFEDDPIGYVQDSIADFFDNIFSQDNVQVGEDVEISPNGAEVDDLESRNLGYEGKLEKYIKTHDVTFKLPLLGTVRLNTKNLDNEEMGLSIKYGTNAVEEGRKSKVKKILTPILTIFLLKGMTLIPFILGTMVYKAWNALTLSIISFVVSSALAIFQLCRKIAENNAQAHLAAHAAWDEHALKHARNFEANPEAQELAYSAYKQ
ncbi:uncharacterized protein LOC130891503 [Diorhabda carinulata]|uniref:uncharacterized protein LOC130891503 n=1 Tax=Diorhabda carinulata TaxID=1163345 RepID=UPI0025A0D1E0|nr:uncharacterized protein LOC130891503 [Diorhabda carinulata]